jgi:hypothetical protein
MMAWCAFAERWTYRSEAQGGKYFGPMSEGVASLFARADVLVNLTGATVLREEHLRVPVRVYLETDPVLPQIEVALGRAFTINLLAAHTHHFSYGENLGAPDCGVPVVRFHDRPTRQPVVLEWWRGESVPPATHFTTIASWEQSGKDIEWRGERYLWSKHHEFLKFLDVPARTGARCELALACGDDNAKGLLRSHGWSIVDALALSKDILTYRDYVRKSRGEFTVAKDQNIRLRSGWFSARSACYLAAGLPVVTQDTGFDKVLPTGEGLFAFNTMDGIRAAFEAIRSNPQRHHRAALAIAEEYFGAEIVLGKLLTKVGL